MLFNVITSLIRPNNLNAILESIAVSRGNNPVNIRWIIAVDIPNLRSSRDTLEDRLSSLKQYPFIEVEVVTFEGLRSPANVGFEHTKDGLICLIDDDNIMHPGYISRIYREANSMDREDYAFLYNQILGKDPASANQRIRTVIAYRVGPGKVDTAQITMTKKLLGKSHWPSRSMDMAVTCPDGVFIGRLYEENHQKFKIINKPLCYYNYLSSPGLDFSLNKG